MEHRRGGGRFGRSRPKCSYCHKLGHTREMCYSLHGRPPKNAFIAQTKTTGNQEFSLSKEEYNELFQYRASKQTSPQVASVAQTNTSVTGNSFACVSQSSTLGPWVMDSGASDHISGNISLLSNIVYSQSLPTVTLANICQTKAKGVGQANPLSSITLGFVLYVPGCPFSLASGNAVLTACYLINRMPSSPIKDQIPHSGYRCYSPDLRRYLMSANVTFFESKPFFTSADHYDISEVLPISTFEEFTIAPPPPSTIEVSPIPTIEESSVVPPSSPATGTPLLTYHHHPRPTSGPIGSRPAPDHAPTADPTHSTPIAFHKGKSTVGFRWVYVVKVGPDGQIDQLKARIVAKGYTQIFGLYYSDTFSPMAKVSSVRLFLSMVAVRYWPLYQMDIKNAFLHGDLEDEVYMEQPPSFIAQGGSRGLVCHLRRSHYGLKQSPRAWFDKFSTVIQEFGMTLSEADHSVFYRHSASKSAPGKGLLFEDRGHKQIVGYSDADWVGSHSDRRSTSGYHVLVGGNLVSWKSKKQNIVARSSAEEEYREMAMVTSEGVATDPRNVEVVQNWPESTSVKQLRGLLGLAGYYRRFIRNYGVVSKPLTEFLKKDSFKWTDKAVEAFNRLKEVLTTAPVLALPDFSLLFVVEIDACNVGIGVVLM
ncbi:uncharacterized protein [Nicotiana tomentosiformis]|uniref:uncharacterized protein n=1 Tax=Nicotiana tomentosiformis TaxID=4098 RepID=UPI00388CB2CC